LFVRGHGKSEVGSRGAGGQDCGHREASPMRCIGRACVVAVTTQA
jgi:hypothetical protein